MAGLLDALNTDEARLGLGLLAAGGYSPTPMSFGQRVQSAMQGQDAQKRGALQNKLLQSQVDENASQAMYRQQQTALALRKQAERAEMLGTGRPNAGVQGGLLATPPTASAGMPAQPGPMGASTPEQQAALSQLPPPPPQVQTKLEQLSQRYKIPLDSLKFDVAFNDGKGLAEMIAKRGTPDMQVSNGYAYDKNQLGAGFMPSLTTSTTGQTSMTRIGPDGMPVVSAPEGALATYGKYKSLDAGLGAAARVNLRKNPNGTESPVSELDENPTLQRLLGGGQPGALPTTATAPGAWQATNPGQKVQLASRPGESDLPRVLTEQLDQARQRLAGSKLPEDVARANSDIKGIESELRRAGAPVPTQNPAGAPAYGMTDAQATQAAANKQYALDAVKDIGETRKTIMNAGFAAPSTIAKYQQLGRLLQDVDGGTLTATGTNIASTMNSLGFKIDKNLSNKEAAAALGNEMALELRNPANGAGMPGAMSDADRNYLVSMIPNASQSAEGRKQLLEAKIAVEQRKVQTANFARNYEKKHGRLDNDFFEQMTAWSAQNPLFKGK